MTRLIFDIGGTWIKGAAFEPEELEAFRADPALLTRRIHRVASPEEAGIFAAELIALGETCTEGRPPEAVIISTAGIVHASGRWLTACADHLAFLRDDGWVQRLEEAFACPVTLINDAEAFLLGAAERGHVSRLGTLCALVVGTGLGCAVSKDARHWRPQRRPSLLGSIRCAGHSFDSLASASRLAAHDPLDGLAGCLLKEDFTAVRHAYFLNLSDIIISAAILHHAETILLGGGLADAARDCGFDLAKAVSVHWQQAPPPELGYWPQLVIASEGNALSLLGAAALADSAGPTTRKPDNFQSLLTEQTHPAAEGLHRKSPREIIEILWRAETDASDGLSHSLDSLAGLAEYIVSQWESGGRIIYVGAGTSGRVAALDAVEIPCTFGASPDRVVAVVAGGLIEAGLSIESEGEEDYSGVPDLILLQPGPLDTVIGISASGSAAYVRSALGFAHRRGARTAMLKAPPADPADPWDWTISLGSSTEIVAGSTRMKAGTATKKALNFLTTTVMAKTGKLHGPYMVDMACLNAKLVDRAKRILGNLFDLSEKESEDLLARNEYRLHRAIASAEKA